MLVLKDMLYFSTTPYNIFQNFLYRPQLMWFNVYLAFLQYLQFTYQKGVLYRLRSLGERNDMDITIDGFHSWMWKGNKA